MSVPCNRARSRLSSGTRGLVAEQLWETTMDPENRHLLRVQLDDAEQANEIFPMLMGTKVGPRRDFIEQNAKFVENLDL